MTRGGDKGARATFDGSAPALRRFTALLAATMGVPSLVTFAVGALGPSIVAELALTRTQLGLIGSLVSTTAVLGSLALGRVVDGRGARSVTFGLLLGSAIPLVLLAVAPSYPVLLAMGVISGAAQACANPVTNTLISRWAPTRQRGTVMGVKQSGVQLAQFAVGVTLPSFAVVVGWRLSLLAPILLVAIVAIWANHDLPRAALAGSSRRRAALSGALRRELQWLCAFSFLLALSVQPINIYLPLYAFEADLLSAAAAGSAVGLVGAAGVCARVLMGRLAASLPAPSICLAPLAGLAVVALSCLAIAPATTVSLLWLGALLFAVSALAGNVVIMLTVLDRVPAEGTGHASGLVSAAMFVGFAVGPVAFGSLVDRTGDYSLAWLLIAACCGAATLVGLRIHRRHDAG